MQNLLTAEGQHLPGQGGAALGSLMNFQRCAVLLPVRLQLFGKGAAVAQNHREQIVEVVGNSSGQSADGLHFLRLAELRLQLAALRQIPDRGGNPKSALRFQKAQADFDREFRPVFSQAIQFQPCAHGPATGLPEKLAAMSGVVFSKSFRNQNFNRFPKQFGAGVAERSLGLRVDELHCPFSVYHHHGIRSRFQQTPKFRLGCAKSLRRQLLPVQESGLRTLAQ